MRGGEAKLRVGRARRVPEEPAEGGGVQVGASGGAIAAPARAGRAMGEPLVSVVLPVFNGARYIEAAVRSVLAQSYANLDLLVIDDGSTDDTASILQRLGRDDGRVRVISRENRGLIPTLNEGLQAARGQLVARMDADDICYPERIAQQVAAFRARPDLAMCGTGFDIVNEQDRVQAFETPHWPDEDLPVLSRFFCAFRHSTVMFNRGVLGADVLVYRTGYAHAEDFELFRRVTAHAPTRILPQALIAYRVHRQSVTATRAREMRRTHLRVVQEALRETGEPVRLGPLLEPASPMSADLLEDMLRLERAIQAVQARAPATQQRAYDEGARGMFFFLLHLAQEEYGSRLATAFLDATDGWARLRRRERLPLQRLRRAPRLAGGVWRAILDIEQLGTQLRSRPLAQVVAERASAPGGAELQA